MAEFFDDQGRADDADDSNDSFIFPRARSRPSRLEEEFTATSASAQQSGRDESGSSATGSSASLYFGAAAQDEQRTDTSQSEMNELYSEVLYSLVHNIGSSDVTEYANELFSYLRHCFHFDEVLHQELLDGINEKSQPQVTLNVDVIEARGLIGKDVSGLSDPYCTMSVSGRAEEQENTSVKQQTLRPVWNEKFHLKVENVDEDVLNLQVWDFDADESVKNKISNVKGYRGFGKFLKEITASSRAAGPSPEFLGQVSLPLKEVPLTSTERWLPLMARDAGQAKERGEIRLRFSFSIQKDQSLMERYKQYEQCLRILFEYEIGRNQAWRGQIVKWAFIILRQLAAHQGLSRDTANVCLWSFYSEVLSRKTLDFSFVHKLLELLDKSGDPLPDELNDVYWNSAAKFIDAALSVIRNIRHDKELRGDTPNLMALLQCLKHLDAKGKFRPDFPDLYSRIEEEFNSGTTEWWDHSTKAFESIDVDEDRLECAIDICHDLIDDVERVIKWQTDAFNKIFELECFPAVYRYYDQQLTALCKSLVESITEASKSENASESTVIASALQVDGSDPHAALNAPLNPMMTMRTALFQLYLALQKFHRLSTSLSASDEPLYLQEFHLWFSSAVSVWFDMAFFKAMIRIGKAIHIDPLTPIDTIAKHSSSAVDTVAVFYQVKIFWDQLSWPDQDGAIAMVIKVLDDIARCSMFYAETICLKLEKLNLKQSAVFCVNQTICVAVNDIVHVRDSIRPLAEHLGIQKLINILQENNNDAAQVLDKTRVTVTENLVDNINSKLEEVFICIAQWMESEVAKIFSSKCDPDQMEEDMIRYLDENLQILNSLLDSSTFDRFLEHISQSVIHAMHNAVCRDIEKNLQPPHFRRWNDLVSVTVKFFFGVECEERQGQDEGLVKVLRLLRLHGTDSGHLMRLYHLERKTGDDHGLGTLAVRALFVDETLTVEILNGRNLKKMDVGGSADPYVKVQLLVPDTFPPTQKTKVQKNTLVPLFDETFTFEVAPELQTRSDCMILLTVKDYDVVGSDEFMGDAVICFDEIPRGDTVSITDLEQIHLNLSSPSSEEVCEYLKILERRSWDATAKKFIKSEHKKMLCK